MKVVRDFDLTNYNSYKIKAICDKVFIPEQEQDLIAIYRELGDIRPIILGGGYNIIFSKERYEQPFILMGESFSNAEVVDGTILLAEAGADMKKLSEFALRNNLSGIEMFYDIPSSLGGAVVMNAGASGEEIKDVIIKVRYLDLEDLEIKEIKQQDIHFEYRNSFFQRNTNKIVLRVWLQLEEKQPEVIEKKMKDIKASRWAKQPKDFPNAGSVFKRPQGFYVGTMIEELGLKGLTIGGAQVSKKHAGFIVNYNKAIGGDIVALIGLIKEKVLATYGVDLEVEQRII